MPVALRTRYLTISLAALALGAASLATTAVFEADRPGADLAPLGGADQLVEVLQGNQTLLWTSLRGPVAFYRVEGWGESIGGSDLGGALVIARTHGASSGVIDLGEKPRSLELELAG
jgi:hypothetical protein